MTAFARSAGLVPGGVFFHCGGERLWVRAPEIVPAKLCVALVPFTMNDRHPPDARGMVPQLIEKTLLMAYLQGHDHLPLLNQDGCYVPPGWEVTISSTVLAQYLEQGVTRKNSDLGKKWLLSVLESAYKVRGIEWIDRYSPWTGFECTLSKRWYAYLGSITGSPSLDFQVWSPESKYFEAKIATPEDSKFAVWEFYKKWSYGT